MNNEYFGNEDQINLALRGEAMWSLLRGNPVFSFYGRMVSLCAPNSETVLETVSNLARLQGATSCQYYPAEDAQKFCDELKGLGLNPSRYEQFRGETDALETSRAILAKYALPGDLSLITVDQNT